MSESPAPPRDEIARRRDALSRLRPGQLPLAELLAAVAELGGALTAAARAAGVPPAELAPVTPEGRTGYIHALRAAAEAGDAESRAFALARAYAADPLSPDVRAKLARLIAALQGSPAPAEPAERRAAALREPGRELLAGARSFVALAFAPELESDPRLLSTFAAAFGPDDDATLAIHAGGWPDDQIVARLTPVLEAAGVDAERGPDLLAIPGGLDTDVESALAGRAHALLSGTERDAGLATVPRCGAGEDGRLRSLAARRLRPSAGPFSFALKICPGDWISAPDWGDLHFAKAIARELELRGHSCLIQVVPDWDDPDGRDCDVAVHLRGIVPYVPWPGQLNVMWNISHPDKLTAAECERYDLLFAAADVLPQAMSGRGAVLAQATDPTVFFPDPDPEHERELVFVGNSRGVMRRILADLLPTERDLAVWGSGWEGTPVQPYVAGRNLPNDQVRKAYSSAAILLNDHWDAMRERGFVSNRIYDGLACGALVISDGFPALRERFGDAVVTYDSPDELRDLVEHYLAHPEERRERGRRGRELVLREHTFGRRVETLVDACAAALERRAAA